MDNHASSTVICLVNAHIVSRLMFQKIPSGRGSALNSLCFAADRMTTGKVPEPQNA